MNINPLLIPSPSRISLDRLLKKVFIKLYVDKGSSVTVLDVGSRDSPYRSLIRCRKYVTMDVDPASKPDIVSDIHNMKSRDSCFDVVVCTEVLEHVEFPRLAVKNIRRVLKSGGVCILSTRFMYQLHPDPHDFFRFSEEALRSIFKDFSEVTVYHHGNRLEQLWTMVNSEHGGVVLNYFNPFFAAFDFKKTNFPSGYVVYAKK